MVGSGGTGGLQNLIRAYQVSCTEDQASLEGIVESVERFRVCGFGVSWAFDSENSRCLQEDSMTTVAFSRIELETSWV